MPVPAPDAAAEAEATVGLLFLRGEGRQRQDGFSGEVPRKSRSTSSPQVSHQDQKLPQLCPSQLYSLEFMLEDTQSVFTVLLDLFYTNFFSPTSRRL